MYRLHCTSVKPVSADLSLELLFDRYFLNQSIKQSLSLRNYHSTLDLEKREMLRKVKNISFSCTRFLLRTKTNNYEGIGRVCESVCVCVCMYGLSVELSNIVAAVSDYKN